jgi:hypothetical protein
MLAESPVMAYTPLRPRFSRFSVTNEELAFVQPDGTLTVLALATGQVLRRARKHDLAASGLEYCDLRSSQGFGECEFGEARVRLQPIAGLPATVTTFEGTNTRWAAYTPFRRGRFDGVFSLGRWLILVYDLADLPVGTIECLDAYSGDSVWLYRVAMVSPGGFAVPSAKAARSRLQRFSELGLFEGTRPCPIGFEMVRAARVEQGYLILDRQQERRLKDECLGPYHGRFVVDPEPTLAFGDPEQALWVGWTSLVLPLLVVGLGLARDRPGWRLPLAVYLCLLMFWLLPVEPVLSWTTRLACVGCSVWAFKHSLGWRLWELNLITALALFFIFWGLVGASIMR